MSNLANWFSDAGHAALAAFFVALLSVAVSVVAFVKGSRTQHRVLAIEEEREADRKRLALRAELIARIVKATGIGSYRLEIENIGESEATDVVISLDGQDIADHPAVGVQIDELVSCIGPHSFARYPLVLTFQERPPYNIAIRWSDKSGETGEFRTTLTF